MTDPDPRAAFAAMTKALITDFRANGGQVTSGPFAGRPVLLLMMAGLLSPGQSHALPLGTQRSSRLPIPGPQPDVGRMRSPRDGQQVAPKARPG